MAGDHISCPVVNGKGVALLAVGKNPTNGMYTVGGGLAMRGGPVRASTGPVYAAPQHARASALRALMYRDLGEACSGRLEGGRVHRCW